MKIKTIALASTVLSAFACNKKEATPVDPVQNQDTVNVVEEDVVAETPVASEPEAISTQTYEGDGQKVVATYMGDEAGNMSVKIEVNGQTIVLPQTEAWAKGAIYGDGTTEFTNKGQIDKAVLVLDGKTYNMDLVK